MKKNKLPNSTVFCKLASAYIESGDASLAKISDEKYSGFAIIPTFFSYFRSIELSLKAILVHHHVSETQITKKLGHKICCLCAKASEFVALNEIGLQKDAQEILSRYSDNYSSKSFEYPDNLFPDNLPIDQVKSIAHILCEGVHDLLNIHYAIH